MSLTRWHFPRQVLMLLVVVGLRLRGGTLLLPPRAVTRRREATPWAPTVAIHRTLCRLAQVCLWRDEFSRKLIGEGEVVPDIAFSASSPASGLPVDQRTDLVVSLRGKRSEPSPGWFSTVARFADESGLRICTLAQVAGDVSRAQEVAARFPGAVMHPWDDDHLTQEGVAMSAYSRARIVISDRLHVLILASICGAIPVEIVSEPATKVRTHFETIGYRGASHDFQGDEDSALNFLRRTMARQDELSSALVSARVALLEARESFTKHLRTRATQ
ncbi:polysaccharide pyruvyl transferase family protein [Nocardioides sp. MAHUQ-72]|uniref:polysaccharide pyruvyl transferase family protein n=1 Tax=unclassified Nocardioides TaxID=2615069 RepID=UPI003605E080